MTLANARFLPNMRLPINHTKYPITNAIINNLIKNIVKIPLINFLSLRLF